MKIQKVIDAIELWTPTNQSEEFDNVGLIIGNSDNDITGVIVSLDTTEKIIDEAIEKNCNLIVSFHPIIFKGLKKLTSNSYVEKTIIKAIENKVSIYSIHTSLDNHAEGVNYVISKKLGLINTKILIPKENNKYIGMGRIGELKKCLNENEFIIYLKDKMKTNLIRHSRFIGKKIKRIAVLGGSGAFGIDKAISQNADAYVTADLKYHNFFEANNKIVLFDIGHFESEQFTKNLIHNYLSKKFPSFAIVLATTNTNPVNYF
ncbi:MAG: Nif3-like dinuclear metal center hexameric protein [Flavobacteriaceae bacterium]|nr:Nif3-like dinuclear metal center hexameric protein [Flavobacteriaceae bacterium]